MTKKSKFARKYAEGGITDADRQAYNNYVGGMRKLPGYDAVNWQHDQKFQKAAAQQLGFDYSKAGAIQADMKARNASMPGTIAGVKGDDAWGGDPNWVGDRERQKSYRKYEYVHYDKNGKEIGHLQPGFTPLTEDQVNDWTNHNRGQQWQSNDQGIAMPENTPWVPKPSAPTASTTPFVDKSQAIANRQMREADTTGRYNNMYEAGPAPSYALDDVRASTVNQAEMDYYNNKQYDMNGDVMGRGGIILYKTPLPQRAPWPNTPTYGKGGMVRRYEGGGTMNDGRDNLSSDSPTNAPQGPALPGSSGVAPQAPPTGAPPAPTAPQGQAPMENADYSDNTPVTAPAAKTTPATTPAPPATHKYYGFSTQGLAMAGLQGADALVTQAIYNPRIHAREAQMQRSLSQSVTGPTDFYGNGTGMYGDGGKTGDTMREGKPIPKEGFWDWVGHKIRQDQTPETAARENKKYTKPIVDGIRAASAVGQFMPHPMVKYPSMFINSTMGVSDAYDAYNKGDNVEAAKDLLFSVPWPMLKLPPGMKAGTTVASKPISSYNRAAAALNTAGVVDDIDQSATPYYGDGGITNRDVAADPRMANALVESDEQIEFPNGTLMPVTGEEYHSDRPDGMGGKFMNLPPETRVYSKKKMIDKDTASGIMDKKITRKMAPAKLVSAFDTKREEEILGDKTADPISTWTAKYMKGIKDGKKDQVFAAQEMSKMPQQGLPMEFGGTLMAASGGKIRYADGGATRFSPGDDLGYGEDIKPLPLRPLIENPMKGPIGPPQMEWMPSEVEVPELDTPKNSKWDKFKNWAEKNVSGEHNLRDAGAYIPEAIATINAMTDRPIFAQRFQPVYNRANTLNVQADLNRNLSMAYPLLQRSYGNAGVDSGRRNASLATLVDAANELGQRKANYDSTQRAQVNSQNAAIENDANWKNNQMASMMADKMAQRQFNKDRSIENIAQSAFDKSYKIKHGRALEKNTMQILNQMYPNWQYGPNGLTASAMTPWFHTPYGYLGGSGAATFDPGDGIRDSETVTIGGKKYKRVESDRN